MKLPEDFKKKYQALLGAQAPAFFESLSGEVQKGFRLNPLKDNYKKVTNSLDEPVEYVATGYVGEVSGKTLEHQAGHNLISIFYRRKAMGDNKGGTTNHQSVQSLLHYALAFRIQSGGCLIEDEDLRILEIGRAHV